MIEKTEKLRKQLIFRSWHRGTREMDIILGSFADKYVPEMSAEDLRTYEIFLEISDPELYNFYLKKEAVPAALQNNIMNNYLKHKVA